MRTGSARNRDRRKPGPGPQRGPAPRSPGHQRSSALPHPRAPHRAQQPSAERRPGRRHCHPARTSCRPGDRQVILTHRERSKASRLLDIASLDKREIGLDLLQCPARTHQAQQMLHREPVPADTPLATQLAGLDGDAVKTFHPANAPPQRERAMRPHTGLEGGVRLARICNRQQTRDPGADATWCQRVTRKLSDLAQCHLPPPDPSDIQVTNDLQGLTGGLSQASDLRFWVELRDLNP